jgi:hypothetical protein
VADAAGAELADAAGELATAEPAADDAIAADVDAGADAGADPDAGPALLGLPAECLVDVQAVTSSAPLTSTPSTRSGIAVADRGLIPPVCPDL